MSSCTSQFNSNNALSSLNNIPCMYTGRVVDLLLEAKILPLFFKKRYHLFLKTVTTLSKHEKITGMRNYFQAPSIHVMESAFRDQHEFPTIFNRHPHEGNELAPFYNGVQTR